MLDDRHDPARLGAIRQRGRRGRLCMPPNGTTTEERSSPPCPIPPGVRLVRDRGERRPLCSFRRMCLPRRLQRASVTARNPPRGAAPGTRDGQPGPPTFRASQRRPVGLKSGRERVRLARGQGRVTNVPDARVEASLHARLLLLVKSLLLRVDRSCRGLVLADCLLLLVERLALRVEGRGGRPPLARVGRRLCRRRRRRGAGAVGSSPVSPLSSACCFGRRRRRS